MPTGLKGKESKGNTTFFFFSRQLSSCGGGLGACIWNMVLGIFVNNQVDKMSTLTPLTGSIRQKMAPSKKFNNPAFK